MAEMGDDIADAAQLGTDIILTCMGQTPLSSLVAAAFGVPSMGVYLAPSVPTAEFPMPGSAPAGDHGARDNRAAGQQLLDRGRRSTPRFSPACADGWGCPDASETVWDHWLGSSGWPICLGYSPAVVPRPADWPANVDVVGYWWPATPPGWQPAADVTDFLSAGPPPVFIGFGSLASAPESSSDQ